MDKRPGVCGVGELALGLGLGCGLAGLDGLSGATSANSPRRFFSFEMFWAMDGAPRGGGGSIAEVWRSAGLLGCSGPRVLEPWKDRSTKC